MNDVVRSTNILEIAMSAFFIAVLFGQGFVIVALVHVVRDLEKVTQRPVPRAGWSFQKPWTLIAIWFAIMPPGLGILREFTNFTESHQRSDMRSNNRHIETLDEEVKDLKAQLAKMQNTAQKN